MSSRSLRLSGKTTDKLFYAMLVLPALAITCVFIFWPVIDSVIKSFLEYKTKNVIQGRPGVWNDFKNYIKLFNNGKLLGATTHTLIFVTGVVVAQFIIGMTLAVILNRDFKGSRIVSSVMMTPWVVPTIVSALIWLWIYQPQYGLLKYFVGALGGPEDFAILNNSRTALLGVGIAALWKQIPLMALLLLAGLQSVPGDMLEAATIDGASAPRRFFAIVIPYMKNVIKVTVSMSIIENFKQFPLFQVMTAGGPNEATTTLAILSYREAFVSNNLGSGAAVTTYWMLLMIIVTVVYNRLFRAEDMD